MKARRESERKKSRLRIEVGNRTVRVLRSWETGFAVDAAESERLRGRVDLYEGARLVSRCLIVAAPEERDGERIYEFKRATPPSDSAPVDFERDTPAPAGYLPPD